MYWRKGVSHWLLTSPYTRASSSCVRLTVIIVFLCVLVIGCKCFLMTFLFLKKHFLIRYLYINQGLNCNFPIFSHSCIWLNFSFTHVLGRFCCSVNHKITFPSHISVLCLWLQRGGKFLVNFQNFSLGTLTWQFWTYFKLETFHRNYGNLWEIKRINWKFWII